MDVQSNLNRSFQASARPGSEGDGACAHDWQNIGYDKDRRETLRACNHPHCNARDVVPWEPDETTRPLPPALVFQLSFEVRRARRVAFSETRVCRPLLSTHASTSSTGATR